MKFNTKLIAILGLSSAVVFMAMAPVAQKADEPKFKNLKVLPKNITEKQMHEVMEEWEHALGARCSFCHERNQETNKMDFASDAKPEKQMARDMFKMTQAINKKYFHSKKDSTGVVVESSVNCYSCHRGVSHPEIIRASELPRAQRPGQAPAGTPPPPPPAPPAGVPASNGK
ncbi:c-type cytochrome [Mucilaginibacter conchicola]|uniref:Photosynthetic reaction center cytochrome c subunit n=1 Tax=Mucilaginibacter conchicola TaxID=2303333 RepID=A0A372NPR3_9SPHI|nr:c-type cytochrome [Mucilaginibacter conchicola]RFZ90858.1 c-type cytochrome [Mucilaginibacter conchicola]